MTWPRPFREDTDPRDSWQSQRVGEGQQESAFCGGTRDHRGQLDNHDSTAARPIF